MVSQPVKYLNAKRFTASFGHVEFAVDFAMASCKHTPRCRIHSSKPGVFAFWWALTTRRVLADTDDTFCSHSMTREECRQHLPTEAEALQNFMDELGRAPMPQPGSFEGRGIVMSGGPMHVLQALANLEA